MARFQIAKALRASAVETAAQVAEKTGVASAHQPGTHIGPVVSKGQWEKIQDLIQKGIDEGCAGG